MVFALAIHVRILDRASRCTWTTLPAGLCSPASGPSKPYSSLLPFCVLFQSGHCTPETVSTFGIPLPLTRRSSLNNKDILAVTHYDDNTGRRQPLTGNVRDRRNQKRCSKFFPNYVENWGLILNSSRLSMYGRRRDRLWVSRCAYGTRPWFSVHPFVRT